MVAQLACFPLPAPCAPVDKNALPRVSSPSGLRLRAAPPQENRTSPTLPSAALRPSVGAWRNVQGKLELRASALARHGGRVARLGTDVVAVLRAMQELWTAALWERVCGLDADSPLSRLIVEVHRWVAVVVQEFEEHAAQEAAGEDAWNVAGRAFTEESLLHVLCHVEPARAALDAAGRVPESAALLEAVAHLHRHLRETDERLS